MNWRRVARGAFSGRLRQTRTMLEARALVPMPTDLDWRSVLIGHVPVIAKPARIAASINAQSCKGLEFDTAILADIDEHYYSAVDPDATKRMFYVMVARAIDRVFLFKKAGRARIDDILPDDPNIMRRQEL